jgi:transposase
LRHHLIPHRNESIRQDFIAGSTVPELAAKYGIVPKYIRSLLAIAGLRPVKVKKVPKKAERNKAIAEMRKTGAKLGIIGKVFGITKERVRQICKAAGLVRYDDQAAKARKLAFFKAYQEGAKVKDLAEAAGLRCQTVQRYINQGSKITGIVRRKRDRAGIKKPDPVVARRNELVIEAYLGGLHWTEICKVFGIGKHNFYGILQRFGIPGWKKLAQQKLT